MKYKDIFKPNSKLQQVQRELTSTAKNDDELNKILGARKLEIEVHEPHYGTPNSYEDVDNLNEVYENLKKDAKKLSKKK